VHKGAAVLKEAMARVKARNLQLTVVDYGLSKGEERVLDWGGLDVRFTGPRPIAEMADFYRSMDILLAPSIWPESFGLVTREALSAGVWVIATAVGALAEPIEPGVNGSVIPARDSAALAEAIDFAASPDGAAARAGWRVQAGIWLKELPRTDNIATLHKRYGELIYVQ
jgi:glycosyltransferase involved in cell wall biosynthesis